MITEEHRRGTMDETRAMRVTQRHRPATAGHPGPQWTLELREGWAVETGIAKLRMAPRIRERPMGQTDRKARPHGATRMRRGQIAVRGSTGMALSGPTFPLIASGSRLTPSFGARMLRQWGDDVHGLKGLRAITSRLTVA